MEMLDTEDASAAAAADLDTNTLYLVQLSKGKNSIVHTMIHHDEIDNATDEQMISEGMVLVYDGTISQPARVLFMSENEELIQEELERLKTYCFNLAFIESDSKEAKSQGDVWLLVQYSCGPTNHVYAVVHSSETVLQKTNCYPDVVAYLNSGFAFYQAIILRKSPNRKDLDDELKSMKEACIRSTQLKLNTLVSKFTKQCLSPRGAIELWSNQSCVRSRS